MVPKTGIKEVHSTSTLSYVVPSTVLVLQIVKQERYSWAANSYIAWNMLSISTYSLRLTGDRP